MWESFWHRERRGGVAVNETLLPLEFQHGEFCRERKINVFTALQVIC